MALNLLLQPNGYPQLFPSEQIILIYQGVYGNLRLENNLMIRATGTLFLTNARIVFVNSIFSQRQFNFALHLNLISRERTVFISSAHTYYEGTITPYANYMPAPGTFKFEMTQDPRPFLNHVTNFLQQVRTSQPGYTPMQNFPSLSNSAYVDPNDPDIIYVVDKNENFR